MFDISPVNCSRWRAPTRSSGGILGSGKWECNMYTERTKWVHDGGFYLCVLDDFPLRLIWLFFVSEGLNLELMCGTSSRGIWFLKRKKKNNKKNKPQLEVLWAGWCRTHLPEAPQQPPRHRRYRPSPRQRTQRGSNNPQSHDALLDGESGWRRGSGGGLGDQLGQLTDPLPASSIH